MERYAVRTGDDLVEAWSTKRLPFEPTGALLDFRSDLRAAVKGLAPRADASLHAVYGAVDDGSFVDTENVLLYNVGTACFRPLAERGMVFERAFVHPTPPPGSGLPPRPLHYHRYSLSSNAVPRHWRTGSTIASFEGVELPSLEKPAPVWAAIRTQASPPRDVGGGAERFAVNLRIRDRRPERGVNLAGLVKPILDGVISAFHAHGGASELVSRRLAVAGIGDQSVLERTLVDPRWGALGARVLVRPFGAAGVQWNPADELCVAVSVALVRNPGNGPRWQISGELAWAEPL